MKMATKKKARAQSEKSREKMMEGRLKHNKKPTRIYVKRVESGISQEDLAKRLAMSPTSFGEIERGRRLLRKETAEVVARELGLKTLQPYFKPVKNKWQAACVSR